MANKKKVAVPSYKLSITAWKFILQFVLVGIIASLTWLVTDGIEIITLEYPQYTVIISLVTALVIAVTNYLKHYKDTELV